MVKFLLFLKIILFIKNNVKLYGYSFEVIFFFNDLDCVK